MTIADEAWDRLWREVERRFYRPDYSIHGLAHWKRVERNGLVLASRTGADAEIVRLFAIFHDSRRLNEEWDKGHGARGAQLAAELRGEFYELTDDRFALLQYACEWHTDAVHHEDPTIGTCFDADRLDLGRVGIIPSAQFMSTAFGKEIADYGSIQPWAEAR